MAMTRREFELLKQDVKEAMLMAKALSTKINGIAKTYESQIPSGRFVSRKLRPSVVEIRTVVEILSQQLDRFNKMK